LPLFCKKIYLDTVKTGHKGWPINVITEDVPNEENVREALENGPYGRCVYECDNDVLDNQVVNMLLEGGITISFSVVAFTEKICQRQTRIWGTKGELEGDGDESICVYDFLSRKRTYYTPEEPETRSGHGGGDFGLMRDFIDAVKTNNPNFLKSTPRETLDSHLLVFAAEESRTNTKIVNLLEDW